MVCEQTIREAVRRIIAVSNPSKVIMFGSYGRGDADAQSDLDLLVIEPTPSNPYREMVRLRNAVGSIGVGVDVLVCSPEEVERRAQVPGTIIYWALKEGRVIYDAAT